MKGFWNVVVLGFGQSTFQKRLGATLTTGKTHWDFLKYWMQAKKKRVSLCTCKTGRKCVSI